MKDVWNWFKIALSDMWNDLYRLLCALAGREPKDSDIINPYEDA